MRKQPFMNILHNKTKKKAVPDSFLVKLQTRSENKQTEEVKANINQIWSNDVFL